LEALFRQLAFKELRQQSSIRVERDNCFVANGRPHVDRKVLTQQRNKLVGNDLELVKVEEGVGVPAQDELRAPVHDPRPRAHTIARRAILRKPDETHGNVHSRLQSVLRDQPGIDGFVARAGFEDNRPREALEEPIDIVGLM